MATVGTQNPGTAGATPTMVAASAGGDKVAPGVRLLVVNGAGASINLTLATPFTKDGLALADRVIAVPNGTFPANAKVIDVPSDLYQDPADGLCSLAWSATTSVTFAVLGPQPS